ncbi:MAG TPA: hypothetical protein VGI22_10480 [Xanthobacteraceae bacterium]
MPTLLGGDADHQDFDDLEGLFLGARDREAGAAHEGKLGHAAGALVVLFRIDRAHGTHGAAGAAAHERNKPLYLLLGVTHDGGADFDLVRARWRA